MAHSWQLLMHSLCRVCSLTHMALTAPVGFHCYSVLPIALCLCFLLQLLYYNC